MKILFLSDNFYPEVNAPASRTLDHCREWAKAGAEVTIITCAPNFPRGKVYEGYKNRLWQKSVTEDGLTVIRVWSYIAPNKGFAKRILDYISFMITGFIASLFVKTDVIIATSPQFFTAVAGYMAGLLKRRPWIMEVRDLWPESIRAVGAAPGKEKWLDRFERLELFLYRKAAQIVVVTDAFKRNLTDRGIDPGKISVVKNGVVLDKFVPRPKDPLLLEQLDLTGKFVVGYLGTHGMAHKLDFILRSVGGLPTNIHFLFIGNGAEKDQLVELSKQLLLPNVSMHPSVSKDEIARYLSVIDVALVPLKKSPLFRTVIPSKIFENCAMKKPILLGVEGESAEIINSYGAGLVFEPENREQFRSAVLRLARDQSFYATCQLNCTILAEDFKRDKMAAKMFEVIRSVIHPSAQ